MTEFELPDGWLTQVTVDCFEQVSTNNSSVKTKDCMATGQFPVIDQGQAFIAGYTDDSSKVVKLDSPIVVFGDHTRVVKWVDFDFVPGADGTKLLKPQNYLYPRFFYHQFKSLEIPDKGYARHFKHLRELQFLVPPLAEQKVIADKLDTLLAQVDNTKARLERIPEILKSFRQSVLAAAVAGKLTEEWRGSYECVSVIEYVKEIEHERTKLINAKKLKKSVLPRTAIEQIESDLPNSWSIVHFEHIAAYDGNALKAGPFGSALKKSDCTSSGFRVYGQEQVIAGDESLVTYYINESKFNELSSCAVKSGDILVSLVGTIGKVLILSDKAEKGIINPRLVKLSLQPEINRSYIQFYLQSIVALDFFKGFSHGGTMDILNLGILKDLPINLPPLKEQTEIVRRVEELFAYANRIEQAAQAAQSRVNHLTQSILAKAFRGELTADWRAANPDLISGDNSAEALLAKINAERMQVTKKNKVKTLGQG
jgi:type I restriction enzyme S subunit